MIIGKNEYKYLQKIRQENENIVFIAGVFDIFHPVHIKAISSARLRGDILVVGIVSDLRVKQRKGPGRPILNEQERAEIVDGVKGVDYVFIMDDPQEQEPGRPTLEVLRNLRPKIFQTVDAKWVEYKNLIEENGTILRIVPRVGETSSTTIINRVIEKSKSLT